MYVLHRVRKTTTYFARGVLEQTFPPSVQQSEWPGSFESCRSRSRASITRLSDSTTWWLKSRGALHTKLSTEQSLPTGRLVAMTVLVTAATFATFAHHRRQLE
jgi:hypothetical protein